MPVIEEMDEFVNWDDADPAVVGGRGGNLNFDLDLDLDLGLDLVSPPPRSSPPPMQGTELDLALENASGDDFGFHALQYYETTHQQQAVDPAVVQDAGLGFDFEWETPEAPCHHCQARGHICKRIQEGRYKGYCTSCVALRCHCSFGFSEPKGFDTGETFPANPWPTLGDHPDAIHDIPPGFSAPDLTGLGLASPTAAGKGKEQGQGQEQEHMQEHMQAQGQEPGLVAPQCPKIGARFSRESVKILKNWLSSHSRHPYPTEEEKDALQRLTGLNKTQITNWLANARRRGKIRAPRSTSPHVRSLSDPMPIDIIPPPRRSTPASESMNPLQRWQHSPPEHEPASVTAIARAVSASDASSGLNSPYSFDYTEDGSNRSVCNQSSASSLGTSHGGTSQSSGAGSFASAFSHASRGSFGSLGSLHRGRRRRRRRTAPKRPDEPETGLVAPLKTFQCTFCTETFRTKHDWQRHEKSLHLSLERWVCAPEGPRTVNPETKRTMCCAFCGEAEPDEAHIESHNHSACQERSLEERTFYRKDHLRQHLKLVHNVAFLGWSMDAWKVTTPQIRSRCGFCGIVMDSWSIRVDHLAEHFKTGYTMGDWKGDWGFDGPVLDMVENSIPPYLIHDERNSPLPFEASKNSPETPRDAYELLKSELLWFATDQQDVTGRRPTDEEMQLEACRIVFGAEVLSKRPLSADPSWVRDVIMSSEELCQKAKMRPIRGPCDSRMAQLRINGKDGLFQDCSAELALRGYVKSREALGLTPTDPELREEAEKIMVQVEATSEKPSQEIASFLQRLIKRSTTWLAHFRRRVCLPTAEDMGDEHERCTDPNPRCIESSVHTPLRLEAALAEYLQSQRSKGLEVDDSQLRAHARLVIYEQDDTWDQTAADDVEWLAAFKRKYGVSPLGATGASYALDTAMLALGPAQTPLRTITSSTTSAGDVASSSQSLLLLPVATSRGQGQGQGGGGDSGSALRTGPFFLNDANCYRRLQRELTRYANSTMSQNNPNRHVPTDEELQHQARWILYDEYAIF
jgi:hypothetical protein